MRGWPIAAVVLVFTGIGVANVLKATPGRSEEAAEVQARLDQFPPVLGDWKGSPVPVNAKHLRKAEAQAHLSRLYVHERSKAAVNVLLLVGEPGALGAHDPEVCFAGAGLRQVAAPTRWPVPGTVDGLWTGRYETAGDSPTEVTVSWGWSADGTWKSAENPRLDYSDRKLIFKLYVSRVVPAVGPNAGRDPAGDFLGLFLRELQPRLPRPTSPVAGGDQP